MKSASRRERGEGLGEDEAQERIGRQDAPTSVMVRARIRRMLKPLKAALTSNARRGTTSREAFGIQRGKTSEGMKTPGALPGRNKPGRVTEGDARREVEKT